MLNSLLAAALVVATGTACAVPAVAILTQAYVETGQPELREVEYYHVPVGLLPEPDFAWGLYFDHNRIPEAYKSDDYVAASFAQMADLGFNTCTYYGDADTVGRHLALAAACDLLTDAPVMILGQLPEVVPDSYPELVGYGPDEPRPEDGPAVSAAVGRWHEMGKRCAAAVKVESLKASEALDIWIVNARGLGPECVREGHDLWMYECRFRGTNFDLHRYWTGLYSYAMHKRFGVKQCWTWGYLHDSDSMFRVGREGTWRFDLSGRYEHAIAGPDGPIGSVGLDGMAAGIVDFRILNALDKSGGGKGWLPRLLDRVPSRFWEGTDTGQVPLSRPNMWDLHDAAKPFCDLDAEMRTAVKLLMVAKAGY